MDTGSKQSLRPLESGRVKDRKTLLLSIKKCIEIGEGLPLVEIKKKYTEEQLFYISLKHVTTTKKALCMATGIPVEAACRYKRYFENSGMLKQSERDVICPYTQHPARLISTNPEEFPKLDNSGQFKLFPV